MFIYLFTTHHSRSAGRTIIIRKCKNVLRISTNADKMKTIYHISKYSRLVDTVDRNTFECIINYIVRYYNNNNINAHAVVCYK